MEPKEEKICCTCKIIKPFSDFHKDRGRKTGRADTCKSCLERRKTLNIEKIAQQNASTLQKTCYRCNTTKHISQFGVRYETADGRSRYCKSCRCVGSQKGSLPPSEIVDNSDGTRICNKCHIAKPLLTAFRNSSSSKFGKEGQCRDCVQEGVKTHINNNRVLRTEGIKVCSSCKKEKDVNEFGKCKTFLDGRQVYCLECTRKKENEWRSIHPEATKAISKRKHQRNKTNPQAKMKNCLRQAVRRRIRQIQGNEDKAGSGVKDLGCSIEVFTKYIESLWQPGQNWSNYGKWGWVVDHIKPLASFDLTVREQLLEACHYTNLRPMWWQDNLEKGTISPEEFTKTLSSGPAIPPSMRQLVDDDPLPEPLPGNLKVEECPLIPEI